MAYVRSEAPLTPSPLRPIVGVLLLVGVTTLAVGTTVRGLVGRELATPRTNSASERTARRPLEVLPGEIDEVLAELDTRIALTGGIVACVAIAWTMLAFRRAPREAVAARGTPPGAVAGQLVTPASDPIAELTMMRLRLARTERIAARREVAKQVAHEIKNPLAPIRAAMETLRRLKARDAPEFDGYFDEATKTVLTEVRRIASIVSEFSKFARMPPPRFAPVDIGEILASVAALQRAPELADGQRITLSLAVTPSILADADQLTQVFTNLVQNGLEAAASGTAPARIWIELSAPSRHEVCVRIRDNGPGIEPSIQSRLFEPSVTTKRDGTGLGLTIVQTIVHEHGGEVRHDPDAVAGTTFEVTLPVAGPPLLTSAPAITVEPEPP